jgi:predicted Zn-dependent protease
MDLIELAKSIISMAIQKGADECDVFIAMDEEFSVVIKDEEIESIKNAITKGLGIRVFKDKKLDLHTQPTFHTSRLKK